MNHAREWMFRFTTTCTTYPRTVVLLTLLVTLFFGYFAKDVERDHSAEGMLPANEPIRDAYREFKKHFNIRDRIAIAFFDEHGVFTPEIFAQVDRISKWLEASGLMDDVISLTTVENITASGSDIFTGPLVESLPATQEEAGEIRSALKRNDMIAKPLVSPDEKATLVIAQPIFHMWDTVQCVVAHDAIQSMLKEHAGSAKAYLAGYPMIVGVADKYMDRDNRVMLPLILIVVVLLLWMSFHSVRGIWIPLAVVAAATVWTMGGMHLVGLKITFISSSIPIVLVAMGIADGIHIIHEYNHHLRSGRENRHAVLLTMQEMNGPVIMTSVTTAAGFLALGTSEIVPVREYGASVAFGIMAAMVFSLSFIPSCLVLLGKPRKMLSEERVQRRLLHRLSGFLGRFGLQHTKLVVAAFLFGLVITGVLALRIRARQNPVDMFRKHSEIRIAESMINTSFPGTGALNVLVDSGEEDGIKDPDLLQRIHRVQDSLESMPEVGDTLSVSDFLARMHRVLHNDDPAYERVPGTKEDIGPDAEPSAGKAMVSQYLLLYDLSGGSEMENYVDDPYQRANIAVSVKGNDSRIYERVVENLDKAVSSIFPKGTNVSSTGSGVIVLKVVQYLVLGQIYSLTVSFGIVLLMLVVLFRSLVYALLGIIPLVITISFNFAFMVLTGIPLNMGTALIASVCIGIGVDYSIHFITRYRIEAKRRPDLASTVYATMETSGRAIFLNAAAVGCGFAVLLFSNFMPLVYLGFLMPMIMAVNAFGALLVIPAFLNVWTRGRSSAPA